MLDKIKYFPLALYRSSKKSPIRGPYIKHFTRETWQISDSQFHLMAPSSQPIWGGEKYGAPSETKSPNNQNINGLQLSPYSKDFMPNQRWKSDWFFARQWYFVGPWFSGKKAGLRAYATVHSPNTAEDYINTSFFHPRVFESAIADFLNSYYGFEKSGKNPMFRGPLEWNRRELSSTIQGACFDIERLEGSGYERIVVFPASHHHFVRIVFDFGGVKKESPYMPTMLELAESIINTFELKVGPQMLAEWNKVKDICPDMSLTDTFGALRWPIKPENVGKPQAPIPEEPNLINRD